MPAAEPLALLSDIYLRASTVPGVKPAPGDIELGELMINAADQVVFVGSGRGGYFAIGAGAAAAMTAAAEVQVDNVTIIKDANSVLRVGNIDLGTF